MDTIAETVDFAFTVTQFSYAYHNGASFALANVEVKIPRGSSTAILGLSGSGKSTLLAVLGRLIECRPPASRICFRSFTSESVDYATLGRSQSSDLRLSKFGFIMQSANMLTNFSCRSNIEMPLTLQGVSAAARSERLDALLNRLRASGDRAEIDKLIAHLDRLPTEVSGGQRQRMAVLRALIHDPEVVFADEPCNSLDPLNAALFRELLATWHADSNGKRTLILVTHNAHEAWRISEQIAVVERHGIGELPLFKRAELAGPAEIEQRIMESGRRTSEA